MIIDQIDVVFEPREKMTKRKKIEDDGEAWNVWNRCFVFLL